MTGSHEIYIIRAFTLQLEKNVREPLDCDILSDMTTAYRIVLAEYTAQITSSKKYRAGACCA